MPINDYSDHKDYVDSLSHESTRLSALYEEQKNIRSSIRILNSKARHRNATEFSPSEKQAMDTFQERQDAVKAEIAKRNPTKEQIEEAKLEQEEG